MVRLIHESARRSAGTGTTLVLDAPINADVDESSDGAQDVVATLGRHSRSREQPLQPSGVALQEAPEELGGVAADHREITHDCEFANVQDAALLLAAHHRFAARQFSPSRRRV